MPFFGNFDSRLEITGQCAHPTLVILAMDGPVPKNAQESGNSGDALSLFHLVQLGDGRHYPSSGQFLAPWKIWRIWTAVSAAS